jgi:hypothetical protein
VTWPRLRENLHDFARLDESALAALLAVLPPEEQALTAALLPRREASKPVVHAVAAPVLALDVPRPRMRK